MGLYAVTGAAGFIGSHLTDALIAGGHRVRGLDNLSTGRKENLDPRCDLIVADVTDAAAVRELMDGADGCFHLAAIASVQRANEAWLDTHRVNLGGTIAVLDAARAGGGVPVVYASSAAVYGDVRAGKASEDTRPSPLTAYGADKLGSEQHARVAFLVHGVPNTGLRFFNVYGPRQDPMSPYSGVISIFARRVAAEMPVTINGAGDQVRDFIHVTDVVAHLLAGMEMLDEHAGANVFNVCTGRGTSVLELARLLSVIEGRAPAIEHGPPRPGDIRVSIGDPTAAIGSLGVAARMTLRDGLSGTLAHMMRRSTMLETPAGD
jgi:UDP-glucose 4-epimerase